jgi:isoquinoline 1-oxidoreductase subunit alpha
MLLTLTVNGTPRTFDGDPAMPLLWFLRDTLALTGAKYGCGTGLCGSCTVHVDGRPARACTTPMKSAAGRTIVTIEGLDPAHPVKQAWQELNVPQCGYCQTGQIMSAAALVATTPAPTDEDIDTALRGNICRCGTYQRIRDAVKKAAGVTA